MIQASSRSRTSPGSFHEEAITIVAARPEELFVYLDDPARLGAHMEKRSMMMMGGRMTYEFDAARGEALGSVIKMGWSFLGLRLDVEEVVVEHNRPRSKAWETVGTPRMLIISHYRMGFEITPVGVQCRLRVYIVYDRPMSLVGRVLGALFGKMYARWCVARMTTDAARHFEHVAAPTS